MKPDPTVRVVDDDPAVRSTLRRLIELTGLHVETYADAKGFLQEFEPDVPGCLVLDVRLPGYGGLELQERLVAEGVGLPVIIITGHGDVPIAVRAMRLGALDCIEKPFDHQLLLQRIRQAVELDLKSRRARSDREEILARIALLTPRERDVLERVVHGRANKQIATDLGITTKTVESHRAHVMDKMRAGSLAELVQLVQSVRLAPGPAPIARP